MWGVQCVCEWMIVEQNNYRIGTWLSPAYWPFSATVVSIQRHIGYTLKRCSSKWATKSQLVPVGQGLVKGQLWKEKKKNLNTKKMKISRQVEKKNWSQKKTNTKILCTSHFSPTAILQSTKNQDRHSKLSPPCICVSRHTLKSHLIMFFIFACVATRCWYWQLTLFIFISQDRIVALTDCEDTEAFAII